jgi:dephospho-CoA kinase
MARMPGDPPSPPPAARPFRPARPLVIGVLGGIASGKSTVARMFAPHGLRHVDADAHARAVTAQPAVLADLAAEFGGSVVAGSALDREALARIVFADAGARARLERIVHPRIRARILAELDDARTRGESVILDAPLLLEGGLIDWCDEVVFVETAETTRRRRASERGWSDEEFARREAAQRDLATKRARSGHEVRNDGDLDETRRHVAALLQFLADRVP